MIKFLKNNNLTVVLECGVSGDPPPHVEWRRHDGVKIPASRIRVDHIKTSLRLERLVASDAGRYVCEAENSVGSSSAFAQLTILVPVILATCLFSIYHTIF